MLAGYADGSVWCFDLGEHWASVDQLQPQLLVPSSFPEELEKDLQIKISADFLSDEALGASIGAYTLLQFNLAVATWPSGEDTLPTRIGVWRVCLRSEAGTTMLDLGESLSSFKEVGAEVLCLSLYGSSVGYCIAHHSRFIAITDWAEADGKQHDDGLFRWYIPHRKYEVCALIYCYMNLKC